MIKEGSTESDGGLKSHVLKNSQEKVPYVIIMLFSFLSECPGLRLNLTLVFTSLSIGKQPSEDVDNLVLKKQPSLK